MSKATLTLMLGFPRSGKTTWIMENKTDEIIIEQDWIRTNIFGHQFHTAAEPFLLAVVTATIRLLLAQGKDVILDSTGMTKDIRSRYTALAKEQKAKIRYVWVKTSMDTCCKRNEVSPEGHKIYRDTLRAMAIRLERPMVHEYDELIEVEEK